MYKRQAERSRLEEGDIIVAVENEKINSLEDILEIIELNDLRPGNKLKIRIWREGRYMNRSLILGEYK